MDRRQWYETLKAEGFGWRKFVIPSKTLGEQYTWRARTHSAYPSGEDIVLRQDRGGVRRRICTVNLHPYFDGKWAVFACDVGVPHYLSGLHRRMKVGEFPSFREAMEAAERAALEGILSGSL